MALVGSSRRAGFAHTMRVAFMRRYLRRFSFGRVRGVQQYRDHLRYEFGFSCCYCGRHEEETRDLQIEHFMPQDRFLELRPEYGNLYLACHSCNRTKSYTWPTDDEAAAGYRFVDPCAEALVGGHAYVDHAFVVVPKSRAGEYSVDHLNLNRYFLVSTRRADDKHLRGFGAIVARKVGVIEKMHGLSELWRDKGIAEADEFAALIAELETCLREILQSYTKRRTPMDELGL